MVNIIYMSLNSKPKKNNNLKKIYIFLNSPLLKICISLSFNKNIVSHIILFPVRKKIGPFAQPDFMQDAPGLPKTRSGKIMRRVLRKILMFKPHFYLSFCSP